uniref:Hyaluronan-mediated motility receptor C-terminal domain-containing protein n=1 Tax=Periophthalmus magnuspinnatus TaxID=409849 RepID=A0A3B4A4I1_9GOBI
MSFSKAPLKRFNDHVGCAPPPGAYDVKHEELRGAASFDKSERFRPPKPDTALLPPPSPSKAGFMSPVRRTMSVDGLANGASAKKEKNTMSIDLKQHKLLEKEIRALVQQRGEQDRRLQALEEDLKKAEAKLLAAVREKTALAANVTTLERQRAELKKINEFLKNKVSADASKKRINSLTMDLMEARNNLDAKNKELNVLRVNTEGQVKALETDLRAAKETVKTLKERNADLDDLHQVTKSQIEDAENENAKLQAVIRELRQEVQVLQGYLDTANDHSRLSDGDFELQSEAERQIAQLEAAKDELRQKEEEALYYRQDLDLSKDVLREMEMRLESQELELKSSQESVKDLEDRMMTVNKELQASHATVRQQEAELSRLREVLRRTENELDERVAHLEQRCLFAEEDRSKTQKEGLRRVEELKAELNSLKEAKKDEETKQTQLQEEHEAVCEELAKEKVKLTFDSLRRTSVCDDVELPDGGARATFPWNLLEVRARLVRKEDEMKEAEESNAALISQLQQEMEQLKRRGDVRGQVEAQTSQTLTQLQNEKESARKLLEDIAREKEELLKQVQDEKRQRVEIEMMVKTERGALEDARKDRDSVKAEVVQLQTRIRQVNEEKASVTSDLEKSKETQVTLENRLKETERVKNELEARLEEVLAMEEEVQRFKSELEEQGQETRGLEEQVEVLTQEKVTLQWEMEEQRREFDRRITDAQLNAFAAEKDALLNEKGANQEELNKLSDAYARLLGHQNQKQKIKHVLKDENLTLKQEVSKLRTLVSKQKSEMEQLRSKVAGTQRRFDPSKAFQHDKENMEAAKPLRDGEYPNTEEPHIYSIVFTVVFFYTSWFIFVGNGKNKRSVSTSN